MFLLTIKIVGERDFPIQNSYTGQVQCLSHSRDQKVVTSLVQSAIVVERINGRLKISVTIERFSLDCRKGLVLVLVLVLLGPLVG